MASPKLSTTIPVYVPGEELLISTHFARTRYCPLCSNVIYDANQSNSRSDYRSEPDASRDAVEVSDQSSGFPMNTAFINSDSPRTPMKEEIQTQARQFLNLLFMASDTEEQTSEYSEYFGDSADTTIFDDHLNMARLMDTISEPALCGPVVPYTRRRQNTWCNDEREKFPGEDSEPSMPPPSPMKRSKSRELMSKIKNKSKRQSKC